ncbi:MAG: hypothetical protein ACI90V_011712 [Bacillariaceae sp.]|jgi:hypothetical protein
MTKKKVQTSTLNIAILLVSLLVMLTLLKRELILLISGSSLLSPFFFFALGFNASVEGVVSFVAWLCFVRGASAS